MVTTIARWLHALRRPPPLQLMPRQSMALGPPDRPPVRRREPAPLRLVVSADDRWDDCRRGAGSPGDTRGDPRGDSGSDPAAVSTCAPTLVSPEPTRPAPPSTRPAPPVTLASTAPAIPPEAFGEPDPIRLDAGNARLYREQAALKVVSALQHAQELLARLQAEPETTGVVLYDDVTDVYNTLLADLGWAPRHWQTVSQELRRLTGARKRYVNKPGGGKLLVFDIPAAEAAPPLPHRMAA